MEKIKGYVLDRMGYAKRSDNQATRRTYFDQAFGAVESFAWLRPELEDEICDWWEDEIRNKFEKIVYGA